MNKKLTETQKDIINTIVVIMLAIIAALVALCLTFASGKAMNAEAEHGAFTGGSECHAYSTSTTVIQPVYDYCQVAKGNGQVPTAKRTEKRTVSNSGTTETTATVTTEDKQDKPTVEHSKHCNNGEGNGSEGCSPAQSSHANNDENNTTPKEDKSNH